MTCYPPDLTGNNPAYKVTDQTIVMFQSPQKIEFHTPVFLDSIAITDMDVPPPRPRLLREDGHWSSDASDIDVSALSNILVNSPDFDKDLVKSITFTKQKSTPQTIQLAYQQLFPVSSFYAQSDEECVDFTPEMLTDMLCRLNWIERQAKTIGGSQSDPLSPIPQLLDEDPHKENCDNVQTETHFVNVFEGKNVIKPSSGPFFRDSVVVRIPNVRTLTPGQDYVVYHTNIPKTKISCNKSGVYEYILMIYAFAGEVEVTTHAYGGEVTADSFRSLSDAVTSVARFLKDEPPITPSSLSQVPAFKTLDARITCLEESMRSLITTGHPTFGDANPLGAVANIFKAQASDTKLHWWSVATLYKVDGSDEIIRADRARYRIRLVESKISADIVLHVDMRLKNPFRLETVAILTDINTINQYDEASPAPVNVIPHFRIIWNDDLSDFSGVTLQMGMIFSSFIETVAIEDFSGVESCWKLVSHQNDPATPIDNTIPLPDGASVWDKNNSASRQDVSILPHPEGYVAWRGDEDINTGSTITVTTNLQESLFYKKLSRISFVIHANGDPVYVEGQFMVTNTDDVSFTIPNVPIESDLSVGFRGTMIKTNNNTFDLSITPVYSDIFSGTARLRDVRVYA